jgi:hypothetical protein
VGGDDPRVTDMEENHSSHFKSNLPWLQGMEHEENVAEVPSRGGPLPPSERAPLSNSAISGLDLGPSLKKPSVHKQRFSTLQIP